MPNFFENLDPETAEEIDQLSRLAYELRENRNAVLGPYGAEDEAALLQRIQDGAVAEHPAYEHYLSTRILADTRETVREVLRERLMEVNRIS
ncbi:MAG: hypothetical protein ROZ09_06360 [Thiobacillus sp.]|jgi:hypothetical protein|uniref:hypothetical protein n=1 Tax=Thiobacillus sp. TaxID=924 RepID=UPI002894B679|nr:hypothetical protein [Thiobacillus sp.]MDT3706433.1 hypothetical protein [Thiobacillus sp.]